MEWQPIETAPKDGGWCLMYAGWDIGNGETDGAQWVDAFYEDGLLIWKHLIHIPVLPSRWRPLPEPPKTDQSTA